jgi:DNA-binding SARP family transcriptional activator
MAEGLRIYLVGPVCVETPTKRLDPRDLLGRQGRLVFALLAGEHRRAITRGELAEELWGEAVPPSWERALTAIVSKLRAALAGLDAAGVRLDASFGCYQLHLPTDVWIDLEAAPEAIHRAEAALRAGDLSGAWGWAAVTYHIGGRPFLAGEEGPWATRTRAELSELYLRSLECLSEMYVAVGDVSLAGRHAEHALRLDPLRETSYQRLMRAHAAAGNRSAALRAYERCRQLLADELGVSPSPQTEAVYLDILRA